MHDAQFGVFGQLAQASHEQLVFGSDPASGLKAIVAIHSTKLGPALGGCRMYPYASEADAVVDVLRLSQGMTLKAAISGLDLGGGKAVIIADPKKDKSEALWRAFGRFVEGLAGRYITAEDVGTSLADMELVRRQTAHVVGIPFSMGGSGDPSPITALGTYAGMRAAAEEAFGSPSLSGRHVAVQGCGHVGAELIKLLVTAGAKVTVADIDATAVAAVQAAHGVQSVAPSDIVAVPCDILAPCAMGGVLNAANIARLACRVVAGAANNQLADESIDGPSLLARGIVYAPDYVINAGGLINVDSERGGYDAARAHAQAENIYATTRNIFAHARAHHVPSFVAARDLALARIAQSEPGTGAAARTATVATPPAGAANDASLRRCG